MLNVRGCATSCSWDAPRLPHSLRAALLHGSGQGGSAWVSLTSQSADYSRRDRPCSTAAWQMERGKLRCAIILTERIVGHAA